MTTNVDRAGPHFRSTQRIVSLSEVGPVVAPRCKVSEVGNAHVRDRVAAVSVSTGKNFDSHSDHAGPPQFSFDDATFRRGCVFRISPIPLRSR